MLVRVVDTVHPMGDAEMTSNPPLPATSMLGILMGAAWVRVVSQVMRLPISKHQNNT